MSAIWKAFPDTTKPRSNAEIERMYADGFVGAGKAPVWVVDRFKQRISDTEGGIVRADDACRAYGIEETGKGKLNLTFPAIEKCYPGSIPGAGQDWGDCFDGDTVVMCPNGSRRIKEIQIGEAVYSGDGGVTTVVSTDRKISKNGMVTVKSLGTLPIRVTPDHRLLVYRLGVYGEKNITRTLYERERARGRRGTVIETYEARTPEWIAAGELRAGDQLLLPKNIYSRIGPRNPFGDTAEADWCLGLWLGDGTACSHKVEWAMSNEGLSSRLVEFLEISGFKPRRMRYRKGTKAWRIRLYCTELATKLQEYYDSEHEKVFPAWAVGRKSLVRGLVDADGTVNGNVERFHNTSTSLVFGVLATWAQLGFAPTVAEDIRSAGSYDNAKPIYRVTKRTTKQRNAVWDDGTYLCRPVVGVESHSDNQVVYDIGVSHHSHSFIANGTVVHNCVSHGAKNAVLATMCNEIVAAVADEVTGKLEEAPEIPANGIRDGVLSPEAIFWWRRHSSDGWFCEEAGETLLENCGAMLRQDYPDLGIDLTRYSLANSKKYGANPPTGKIADQCKKNLVRTATLIDSWEALRDLTANGYGVNTCGSEGFDPNRDANGVSKRKGSWAHSMAVYGTDDREQIHSTYGGGLVLVAQSWGPGWGSGGRRILGTNIDIPLGCFWVKWADWKKRWQCAYSGHAGWPRQQLPDWGWAF